MKKSHQSLQKTRSPKALNYNDNWLESELKIFGVPPDKMNDMTELYYQTKAMELKEMIDNNYW
jgi:hypothetical protein